MIHLNEWLSLKHTKVSFMPGGSLHGPRQMCSTQEEVDVNAAQMILNSVMCLSAACLLSG